VIENVPLKHPDVLFNNIKSPDFGPEDNIERSTVKLVFDRVMHPFDIIVEEFKIIVDSEKVKFLSKDKSTVLKTILLWLMMMLPSKRIYVDEIIEIFWFLIIISLLQTFSSVQFESGHEQIIEQLESIHLSDDELQDGPEKYW